MDDANLRIRVRNAVADYFAACHAPRWDAPFFPGETPVPVSGKVYDIEDLAILMEAVLDFWLTTGRFAAAFEKSFSEFLGTRHTSLCNSGSSANLLAISCLTSPKLKDRRLQPGDEVITLAAGFPIFQSLFCAAAWGRAWRNRRKSAPNPWWKSAAGPSSGIS